VLAKSKVRSKSLVMPGLVSATNATVPESLGSLLGAGIAPSWALGNPSRGSGRATLADPELAESVRARQRSPTLSDERERGPDGHLWPHVVVKQELDDAVKVLMEDLKTSCSLTEGLAHLREMATSYPEDQPHMVKRLLSAAMDGTDEVRQMVAKLLSSACVRGEVACDMVEQGFLKILEVLEEHCKDVPKALQYYSETLAMTILDTPIEEQFLDDIKLAASPAELGEEVVASAKYYISERLGLPLQQYKQAVGTILEDCMADANLQEAADCLEDVRVPHFGHEVVKKAIVLALNMKNRERELVSQLLVKLFTSGMLSEEQMADGFIRLIARLGDLCLDTPDAVTLLAQFTARAVADECLTASFVEGGIPAVLIAADTQGADFVKKFRVTMTSAAFKRDPSNVWGASSKSVEKLKMAVKEILREYFVAGDVEQCLQSVRDLEASHFLHELVSKAILISLDYGTQGQLRAHVLLQTATEQGLVTPTQVAQGLERILNSMEDIVIDVPTAPVLVGRFLFQAFEDGWASRDLLDERKGGPWGEHFARGEDAPSKKAALAELARLESV